MTNPYRSINNQRLLKALFFEMAPSRDSVVYTLKDRDHTVDGVTYPSLYQKYLECDDLTEYSFAVSFLDGWEHWQMLKQCSWFKPYAKRWKEELEAKTLSKALNRLRAEASSSSKNAFYANKFLLERGWIPKGEKSSVGRPSKEAIKAAAEELFTNADSTKEDFERIKDLN